MLIPEMPARSYSTSVRTTLPRPPKPLSQSAITGSSVALSMRWAAASVSDIVVRFTSGIAWAIVATPSPLTQTASKPYFSMSFAVSASWAPTATTDRPPARPSRSLRRFASALFTAARDGRWGHDLLRVGWVEAVDDRDDLATDLFLGIDRLGPDVGREHDVRQVGQRRALAFAFGDVDIERGAAQRSIGAERLEQRGLVDDTAAGDVHEERARLHASELGPADHPPGVGRERDVERDEVALGEDLVRVGEVDALGGESSRALGAGMLDNADRAHAPCEAERRNPRPDRAEADDPEALASQVVAHELRLRPVRVPQVAVRQDDAPGERDHQPERELGDGLGAWAGDADELDPALVHRGDVEVVEPRARSDEEPQVGCGQDARAHADAAPEHDRLAVGRRRRELILRRADREPDVVSLVERDEGGRRDLAGD